MDDFEIDRIVGTGSFGRVCLAWHRVTNRHVAIKSLLKAHIVKNRQVAHVRSERDILHHLDHPFIVRMLTTFQDQQCVHLVMEYIAGGEFFSHLRKRVRLSEDMARFYAAQVVLIFEYLHSMDVVYRDLKVGVPLQRNSMRFSSACLVSTIQKDTNRVVCIKTA